MAKIEYDRPNDFFINNPWDCDPITEEEWDQKVEEEGLEYVCDDDEYLWSFYRTRDKTKVYMVGESNNPDEELVVYEFREDEVSFNWDGSITISVEEGEYGLVNLDDLDEDIGD